MKARELTPKNLVEEKTKFLSNLSYNPQFQYDRTFTLDELEQWGTPDDAAFEFAREQLQRGGFVAQQQKQELTPEHVQEVATRFLTQLGLTDQFVIRFEPNKITRCSLIGNAMIFRSPIFYRSEEELEGTFAHELQTHFLRNWNTKKQGWQIDPQNEYNVRRTEEGLATLHGFLPQKTIYLRKTFLNYFCVYEGQHMSFAELFATLREHGLGTSEAWEYTARVKRGVTDTSQPLCNTKDITYLEGTVSVWRWLQDASHDPHELYIGKVALEDLPVPAAKIVTQDILYPTFFQDMAQYRQKIEAIGKENHLETYPV